MLQSLQARHFANRNQFTICNITVWFARHPFSESELIFLFLSTTKLNFLAISSDNVTCQPHIIALAEHGNNMAECELV